MTNENKPVFTGEVEDWVTQDVVPRRAGIDEYRWVITKNNMTSSWGMTPDGASESKHGHIDQYGARLELRCRRIDYPAAVASPDDWVTQDVVPRRKGVDQYCWATPDELKNADTHQAVWDWEDSSSSLSNHKHGLINANRNTLQVRCKRKDHPVLGAVVPKLVSQDELNAAPRTRAWTFGKPAQTGHFLISFLDPALGSQEITATSIWNVNEQFGETKFWFIYLGQTFDFADPVVPKAKYTLLADPKEPRSKWWRQPDKIQNLLDLGWTIVKEQEYEVPEWDR
jgi:hypothetical protein